MVFTRHFYEQKEVCGALQYSVLNGRVREALFWVKELTDSGEQLLCFRILLETWLLFYGGAFPEWLSAAERLWRGGEVCSFELALNLALCEGKDVSGLYALILQGEPVERIFSDGSLEGYLMTAISQGRARCAMWAAATIGDVGRIWNLLPPQVLWLKDSIEDTHLLFAVICALCTERRLSRKTVDNVWLSLSREQTDDIAYWGSLLGRRGRRIYSVPASQLCGCGPRWQRSRYSSTLERLYNIESSVSSDKDGFWYRALCKSGWSAESGWGGDDAALERFYEEYFPDDIPDEWSLEEQKKSHGFGYLREEGEGGERGERGEKSEVISGGRWSRTWLSSHWRAAAIWAQDDTVNKKLWETKIQQGLWETLCGLSFWVPENIQAHLTPLRRIYATDQ